MLVVVEPSAEKGARLASDLRSYGYAPLCVPGAWVERVAAALRSCDGEAAAVVLGPSLLPLEVGEVCRSVRRSTEAPIIALLEEHAADHISLALDAGADHCLPYRPPGMGRLIVSAIGSVKRREDFVRRAAGHVIQAGPLQLDLHRRVVELNGRPIPLTSTEFGILALLSQNAGRLVTPVDILRHVHGYDVDELEAQDIVKVHISRLRQKLEAHPDAPRCIVNVRRQGYMYADERRGERAGAERASA